MNIKNEIESRNDRIVLRESAKYPECFVVKYKNTVFYDNLWDDFLEECRGMVLDSEYNIISLPFRKIYNFGIESNAPVLDDSVVIDAYAKINGFMIAITYSNELNDFVFSTTGSLDSDFVGYAKQIYNQTIHDKCLFEEVLFQNPDMTFMFECVHPDDPHIVSEDVGLHFIGARRKILNSPVLHPMQIPVFSNDLCNAGAIHVSAYSSITVGDLRHISKDCKTEGFVFYTHDGRAAKIKTHYYLMKKVMMRTNIEKLQSRMEKFEIPEEFIPVYDAIQADPNSFAAKSESERREFIEKIIDSYGI